MLMEGVEAHGWAGKRHRAGARMARPPESVRKEGTRSAAQGRMQERKRFLGPPNRPFALFKRGSP